MPWGNPHEIQLTKMIDGITKMPFAESYKKQKKQKLIQNQRLERELLEYEPVRG